MEAEGRSIEGLVGRARAHPVVLALLLSLISTPIVAVSLLTPPQGGENVGWVRMGFSAALLLALLAVLPAGLVGGALGGRFLARRPVGAVFLALAVAWPIAISLVPVAAGALGITVRAGVYCIDSCTASLTDAEVLSGGRSYILSIILGSIVVVGPIAGLVLLVAAWLVSRGGQVILGIVLAIAGYGAVHWATIAYGGLVSFICLSVGVVAWWYLARARNPVIAAGS